MLTIEKTPDNQSREDSVIRGMEWKDGCCSERERERIFFSRSVSYKSIAQKIRILSACTRILHTLEKNMPMTYKIAFV